MLLRKIDMHPNEQIINTLYTAFQAKDGDGMAACYHPDASFSDPVFTDLHGAEVTSMWRMLCERGKDLQVTFNNVHANDATGSAHWEATYSFSRSGRKVHNIIDATYKFKDGKIIEHRDSFDLWRWAGMALGTPGKLLGWSPPMQATIRKNGMDGLRLYMAKQDGQNR
jgi:ketosteroid isomerase-like protein